MWPRSSKRRWAAVLGNGEALAQFGRLDIPQTAVAPYEHQTLYLWEKNNAPAVTELTVNDGNYSDDPDFRPYLTFYPVPERTAIKGAVLLCPGGAFMFRSDGPERISIAQALSARAYQSFVVDYRLRPYTCWTWPGRCDLSVPMRMNMALASEISP